MFFDGSLSRSAESLTYTEWFCAYFWPEGLQLATDLDRSNSEAVVIEAAAENQEQKARKRGWWPKLAPNRRSRRRHVLLILPYSNR